MLSKKQKRLAGVGLAAVSVFLFAGCSRQERPVVVIERGPYQGIVYQNTAIVQRGNLTPGFTLSLKAEGFRSIHYSVSSDNLELQKLYVSVGDKVEKGDLLAVFRSEELLAAIDDYKDRCSQYELLAEHYEKLMAADNRLDYSRDIEMLRQDIMVAELYEQEAEEKLAGCRIIAEAPGTITEINEYLASGVLNGGRNLITEVTGTGNYIAVTTQDYEFCQGDIYTAQNGMADYELLVSEVTKRENDNKEMEQTILFTPISGAFALSEEDKLSLSVKEPELKDVVYVDAGYVHEMDDRYFVYVLDEEGFRNAVFVTVQNQVSGYLVISEGLSGGEKVTGN